MKKITAIILSLAMVFSMLPAAFAAGETDGVIEYVFTSGAYGSDVDIPAYSVASGRQLVENTNDDTTKNYTNGQTFDDAAYVEPNGTEVPVTLETLDYTETFAAAGTNEWRMTAQYYIADDSKLSTCNSLILSTEGLKWRCNKKRAYPTALIILKVPEGTEGEYTPKITYNATSTGYDASFFLIPESAMTRTYTASGGKLTTVDVVSSIENKEFAEVKWHYGTDKIVGTTDDYSYKQVKSNVDVFRAINSSYGYHAFTAEEKEQYLLGKVNMNEDTPDEETENAELSPVTLNEETYYLFVTYDGTLAASSARNITLCSLAFTPVSAQEKAEAAFDYAESNYEGTGSASITAYAVYGTDGEVVDTQTIENIPSVTYGEVCESITAPEAPDGYKFLYWAKGMTMGKKQVVSYSETIPEYKPHEGVNYLIAVYEEVGADSSEAAAEFYNANGQLLDLTLTEENKLPDLPSMAGYGKAVKWALRNDNGTYTEYEAGADVSDLSGILVFMAKYNDLEKDIKIVINGQEGYYAYGDPVPCTSDAADFSYWTKTVNGKTEIVSTKSSYTFNAYEACTVTAVCEGEVDLGKTMRKIILSTFAAGDETAIMAEFIGFDGALEKGIMFGTQKIAMNTDKTQFTVINDAEGATTVTGYAIVDDGGTNKKITDAEITVGE